MKAIVTKFHGPTQTRGARVSATDNDGNTVTLPYDYAWRSGDSHKEAALALCRKMGWTGTLHEGWLRLGERVFVWENPEGGVKVGG